MSEPIRLVIWDLDETFWAGTLAEDGSVEIRADRKQIVIELARRGIMNSICSKNHVVAAERVLREHNLWDYFIFPSINWDPKGQRIKDIVEKVQLRPKTILFIDDNPGNLREAEFYVPDIITADEHFVDRMLSSPLMQGKDDSELSRLQQYKVLEKKSKDIEKLSDNREFLRQSDIRVRIEYDIEKHIDRAIELINRTNQLNFTKLRLPESGEEGKSELIKLLSDYETQAGLVFVSDKYGDYGFVGIFVVKNTGRFKALIHFCFSCRAMNMGVEQWVYNFIGRPHLEIRGEVIGDLTDDGTGNWITLDSGKSDRDSAQGKVQVPSVYIRGGCEVAPLEHYFNLVSKSVCIESMFGRDGVLVRVDHSQMFRNAIDGLTEKRIREAENIGFETSDFETLYTSNDWSIVILAFWADAIFSNYKHRETGLQVAYGWFSSTPNRELTSIDLDALEVEKPSQRSAESLRHLYNEYEHLSLTSEAEYRDNLLNAVDKVPPTTKIYLLNFDREGFGYFPEYCRRNRNIAKERQNIVVVETSQLITDGYSNEIPAHFDRMTYFRIFEAIMSDYLGRQYEY